MASRVFWPVLGLVVAIWLFGPARAATPITLAEDCTPAMLDITLRPESAAAVQSATHLVAIEIRNRTSAACALFDFDLKLPGTLARRDEVQPGWEDDPPAQSFEKAYSEIAAGGVAHFALAWSSEPQHKSGLAIDDCTPNDGFTVSMPQNTPATLELRHFPMRICATLYVSPLRAGPYGAAEYLSPGWLYRVGRQATDFVDPAPPSAESPEPPLTLWALQNNRTLRGDGSAGDAAALSLFLTSRLPGMTACAYDSLRKREAGGATTITFNPCPDAPAGTPVSGETTALTLAALGLQPQQPGHIDYDATGSLQRDGKPVLASAHLEVTIRDKAEPMLPPIETELPGCRIAQLSLSAKADLGDHWPNAMGFAPPGEAWQDGRVFEVTNKSQEICRLGGTPELAAWSSPGKTLSAPAGVAADPFLLPAPQAICRNCSTALFKARENGWIDLKPGAAAHFMVGRLVRDIGFDSFCTTLDVLDLTLPDNKTPLPLPFAARNCGGQLSVTAWRSGRYDNDPLNVAYDRAVAAAEVQRQAALPPVPAECAPLVTAESGRPMTVFRDDARWFGLTIGSARYGERLPISMWLANPTGEVWDYRDCGGFPPLDQEVEIYDPAGHRIFDWIEARANGQPTGREYSCRGRRERTVPPHGCLDGREADGIGDLSAYYTLPPGRYLAVPKARDDKGIVVKQKSPDLRNGLAFTVEDP